MNCGFLCVAPCVEVIGFVFLWWVASDWTNGHKGRLRAPRPSTAKENAGAPDGLAKGSGPGAWPLALAWLLPWGTTTTIKHTSTQLTPAAPDRLAKSNWGLVALGIGTSTTTMSICRLRRQLSQQAHRSATAQHKPRLTTSSGQLASCIFLGRRRTATRSRLTRWAAAGRPTGPKAKAARHTEQVAGKRSALPHCRLPLTTSGRQPKPNCCRCQLPFYCRCRCR